MLVLPPRRLSRSTVAATAAIGLALTLGPLGTTSAEAHRPTGPRTVATGLNNPRHLSFAPDGTLYVAESGRGGSGPCFEGPEGSACLGQSGSVTALRHGWQKRVVTGLPSLAGADGSQAAGPSDVSMTGNRTITIAVGLGGSPATRTSLGPGAARLGTLLTGRLAPRPHLSVLADVVGYEARHNPDGGEVDSNTSGLIRTGNGYAVTDAGGNDLVRFGKHRSSTLAVFPDTLVDAPPIPDLPPRLPMQAVPTGVAVGPDGAYYVSQLTGFPFVPGASTIWRVVPGHRPTAYATGLTNVTDLTWAGGQLYAVQLADSGLLSVPEGQLPQGSLLKVGRGSHHRTVADHLSAPYGVAVRGSTAYVTTCSVCAGGGSVVAINLR